jgi:hypothetical protein
MMKNALQSLRTIYNEAMAFFDHQYIEFQSKIKYKPLMKLVIENRRLELINSISKHFKEEEMTNSNIPSIERDVNDIKNKTTQDLKFLTY